jgi:hypothetical protein
MSYCVNNGKVTIESSAATNYTAIGCIVGCEGAVSATGTIDHCYNTGSVDIGAIDVPGILYAGGIAGVAAHADSLSHKISYCYNFGTLKSEAIAMETYTGAFVGHIKFFGLELRSVYALAGIATDLAGLVNFEPLLVDGYDFADQATLEKKAAVINKELIEYNVDFDSWLLDLDISNVEEETTSPPETTTPPEETTTKEPDETTKKPEDTTTKPEESTVDTNDTTEAPGQDTEKPGGGCKSFAALPVGISICFALALLVPRKKEN